VSNMSTAYSQSEEIVSLLEQKTNWVGISVIMVGR
jgi:hypothetical protein